MSPPPPRLSPAVHTWTIDGRSVLWNRRTGRALDLSSEGLGAALAAGAGPVWDRLVTGSFIDTPVDRGGWVVARGRLPLFRPDTGALWHPAPDRPTAGGHAWTAITLDRVEISVWDAINDARSAAQVAERASVDLADALRILDGWMSPERQLVQIRPAPPSPRDPSLSRVVSPPRPANVRTVDQRDASGATDLLHYHLSIADGPTHFDDAETTIAHAFALPHPALGGGTYGQALHRALSREGFFPPPGPVVEVGCGDGELAAALHAATGGGMYLRVDLSPGLLRTQRGAAPGTWGVLGDATRLPLADGSVARLLSNEVIADLTAVPWRPHVPTSDAMDEVLARIARYRLPPPPSDRPRWYNLGAWRFVEEIARVLAPGGRAWLSEFGSPDQPPEEAVQLDHPEVGIHFGELAAIGRALGLQARLTRLDALLGLDPRARQLWRPHHMGLRAMCRAIGAHLPARAWTPASLEAALPFPVRGVQWVSVAEDGPGPVPTRFYGLSLWR